MLLRLFLAGALYGDRFRLKLHNIKKAHSEEYGASEIVLFCCVFFLFFGNICSKCPVAVDHDIGINRIAVLVQPADDFSFFDL